MNLFTDKAFSNLKFCCLFIGHPRSGHSLIGSIIDSHPQACIANEYNVLLKYDKFWFKNSLFKDLINYNKEEALHGRVAGGYDYRIPGLSQGINESLTIIGDKDGCKNTHHYIANKQIFKQFEKYTGLPIRLIYGLRNPYDIITTKAGYKDGEKVALTREGIIASWKVINEEAITNQAIVDAAMYPMFMIHNKDLIFNTNQVLKDMFSFLDLEIDENFIQTVQSFLYKEEHRSRNKFPWDDELKAMVSDSILKLPIFSQYTFEN